MKKIAILLASSIDFSNSGMFSVDHAAYDFFNSEFPFCEFTFYVFHISERNKYPYEKIIPYSKYVEINDETIKDIYNSDLIVYWGDFFHCWCYIETFLHQYVLANDANKANRLNLFYRAFFLSGAKDEVHKKTIAFGNSLMFIGDEIEKDKEYKENFINLYSKINFCMPRDFVSLSNLLQTKIISVSNVDIGFDSAFMHSSKNKHKQTNRENKIGLFVGRRTKIKIKDIYLIIKFALINKYSISWIDWMINNDSFLKRAFKNKNEFTNIIIHRLLARFLSKKNINYNYYNELSQFKIVITDTYHLAINALAQGCIVYCVGDGNSSVNKKLQKVNGDIKKEVLFKELGLVDFYGRVCWDRINTLAQTSVTIAQNAKMEEYYSFIEEKREKLVQKCFDIIYK